MAKPRIFVTHAGKTLSLSGWSRETGIPVTVLGWRYFDEWPAERMLTESAIRWTKITPEQVTEIKAKKRPRYASTVAREYGLTVRYVQAIWRGHARK